jgi:hypothetical protein
MSWDGSILVAIAPGIMIDNKLLKGVAFMIFCEAEVEMKQRSNLGSSINNCLARSGGALGVLCNLSDDR